CRSRPYDGRAALPARPPQGALLERAPLRRAEARATKPERLSRSVGALSDSRAVRPEGRGRHVLPLPRPRPAGRHLALPAVPAAGPPALLGAALRRPLRPGHRRRQLLRLRG